MKEFLDKVSSYNLFNNLLPGIVFAVIAQSLTSITFIQSDIVVGVFLYYFIGVIVGRIGSLIVEPLFKSLSIIKFEKYEDFVAASKTDSKLEILSEVNNMYRTFCSLFLLLILLKLYMILASQFSAISTISPYLLLVALLLLFASAYSKQTQFITKRIIKAKGNDHAISPSGQEGKSQ